MFLDRTNDLAINRNLRFENVCFIRQKTQKQNASDDGIMELSLVIYAT
jgi:hypothetical protein